MHDLESWPVDARFWFVFEPPGIRCPMAHLKTNGEGESVSTDDLSWHSWR
jgi:hypothetical protein